MTENRLAEIETWLRIALPEGTRASAMVTELLDEVRSLRAELDACRDALSG